MSDFFERIASLSPKRLALLAVELNEQLEAARAQGSEPVAVVAMACRFPGGADTPEKFWRLLMDGVDAIGDVPANRWDVDALFDPDPNAAGKIASRWGGFISGHDRFEPQMFGISPREATSMDPQQRLLLEVAWEAFERAGYAPDRLAGSSTGVFVGICNGDYHRMLMAGDPDEIDMYLATGNAHSVASGRISYVFGLQGPSLSIDTACSSSLVAIGEAVASLRAGGCRVALAGGVNMILSPDTTIALSRAGMMSRDGRCKAFDAAADGFVRSEGCGLVLLKRLADARADGDQVLAVIAGAAINQDGRSSGLTAPNGPAQAALVRAALRNAGIEPQEVGYVESHGTGTSLGDPIELQALGAVFGEKRAAPLLVGSVKSNLGHLESAAGVAGLVKAVLAVQHAEVPPHLHFKTPNPHIPWAELAVSVPTAATAWPPLARRIAGVSSFGFSGTNAHLLVADAPMPAAAAAPGAERPDHLLVLSARTTAALQEIARRYQAVLQAPAASPALADVAFTAAHGRSALAHRLAVVARDAHDAAQTLAAFVAGAEAETLRTGQASAASRAQAQTAFLFTGQGAQYAGMGKELHATEPTFRAALESTAALFAPHLPRPLLEVMWEERSAAVAPALDQAQYAQPANFALQVALVQMWRSWGIDATAVAGHSAGEYAAAWAAGVLPLDDAAALVVARSRLMQALAPGGGMGVVMAPEAAVAAALGNTPTVSIASLNGPESLTISGPGADVESVLRAFESGGTEVRRLNVQLAAHSFLVDPVLEPLTAALRQAAFHPPRLLYFSSLLGREASAAEITSVDYWRRHTRDAVRFAPAVAAMHARGYTRFVEIGPHPTLLGMARRCLPEGAAAWLPSLRSGQGDWRTLNLSLADLFVAGADLDWDRIDAAFKRPRMLLPTYPFERERYWLSANSAAGTHHTLEAGAHRLLGTRLHSPALQDVVFENRVSVSSPRFLDHHRLFGVCIMPSPAYVEMALAAADVMLGTGVRALRNLVVKEACVLPEDGLRNLQLVWRQDEEQRTAHFEVLSREPATGAWISHAEGRIEAATGAPAADAAALAAARSRCTNEVDGEAFYDRLRELGLEFGGSFHGIERLWSGDGEAVAYMRLPEQLQGDTRAYGVHPALLDSCFHLIGATLPADAPEATYLLTGLDEFVRHAPFGRGFWNHTVLRKGKGDDNALVGDIRLYTDDGTIVGEARGLLLRKADRGVLLRISGVRRNDWLYDVNWQDSPQAAVGAGATVDVAVAAAAASAQAPRLRSAAGLERYAALVPRLEALATGAAAGAAARLAEGGAPVAPQHARLHRRVLEIAAGARALAPVEIDAQAAVLVREFPEAAAEIELTARCGRSLAAVLRGEADPLALLFPGGSLAALEALYQKSPPSRYFNELMRAAVAAAVAGRGESPCLRVVEIGAGTGATTAHVIDALPRDADYLFTDMSPAFLTQAAQKFAAHRNLRTQLLDIEKPAAAQGVTTGGFDIAIAANVLHATRDIAQTLGNVRSLLAPGGVLVLLEGSTPMSWVDITFGMTEGWWRFADTQLRPGHPLLGPAAWKQALARAGFGETHVAAEAAADTVQGSEAVILSGVAATAQAPLDWLIVSDDAPAARAWAGARAAVGDSVHVLGDDGTRDAASWDAALGDAWQAPGRARRAVYLLAAAADRAATADRADEVAERGLVLAQAVARRGDAAGALWFVTRGAQAAGRNDDASVPGAGQAVLWGLGRVLALELPVAWGGLMDLPALARPSDHAAAQAAIASGSVEDQAAVRAGKLLVPRIDRRAPLAVSRPRLSAEASYLVTGGLGGLGLKIAAWLADHGARTLVLTSRRGLDAAALDRAEAASVTAKLQERGTNVHVIAADVANRAAMAAVFARFGADLPPLRGIVHAAAALGGSTVAALDAAQLAASLAPKVRGTLLLDELSATQPLDFFLLFSSTTALWGARELAHYAAANAFLDAFAHARRRAGRPVTAVNWGTWDAMRVASAAEQQAVAEHGLGRMPAAQALDLMGDAIAAGVPQVVVADVDFAQLRATYEARRPRPFLALVGREARAARPRQREKADLLAKWHAARPQARREVVVEFVRGEAGKVLGVDGAGGLDVTQGLFEMGMDSLMSVELKSRLEAAVGRSLPSTLTFNHPSVVALADYLIKEALPAKDHKAAQPAAPAALTQRAAAPDAGERADLSEDELAALLASKLARPAAGKRK